jgi:hypothetical protein
METLKLNLLTRYQGLHWIWPSIAGALFGFGLGSISDAALTLVIDSYRDVSSHFLRSPYTRNIF